MIKLSVKPEVSSDRITAPMQSLWRVKASFVTDDAMCVCVCVCRTAVHALCSNVVDNTQSLCSALFSTF